MAQPISECDWKYMKKLKAQLLAELCDRINQEAVAIVTAAEGSEHAKYLRLYKHTQDADHILSSCFDDWRRSTLFMNVFEIKRQGLLTEAQLQGLSTDTQEKLQALENFI